MKRGSVIAIMLATYAALLATLLAVDRWITSLGR